MLRWWWWKGVGGGLGREIVGVGDVYIRLFTLMTFAMIFLSDELPHYNTMLFLPESDMNLNCG